MSFSASYLTLYESGQLEECADRLNNILRECTLCPHCCGIDRHAGEKGKCRSGILPIISASQAHYGEERPLVGRGGSGTIFFTNCNLACIFCQNYDISHLGRGREISFRELADSMLKLQARGCHNINLVSPSHMIYSIIKALIIAIPEGLSVPLVYNSGGYDSVETLKLIEGVCDIFMPDFKYMDSNIAEALSGCIDYPTAAMAAVQEMYRQVGDLTMNSAGVAERGLLIRHLVLPNNLAATDRVISFIAGISKSMYLNIMDQYRPEYRARENPDLRRRTTLQEYDEAVELALAAGLERIDDRRRF